MRAFSFFLLLILFNFQSPSLFWPYYLFTGHLSLTSLPFLNHSFHYFHPFARLPIYPVLVLFVCFFTYRHGSSGTAQPLAKATMGHPCTLLLESTQQIKLYFVSEEYFIWPDTLSDTTQVLIHMYGHRRPDVQSVLHIAWSAFFFPK